MPKYLVKWPEEGAFIAALVALGSLVTVIMSEAGASSAMTGAVVTLLTSVGRLAYGIVVPTPTVQEAVSDARDQIEPTP